jgi:hypothetical protein
MISVQAQKPANEAHRFSKVVKCGVGQKRMVPSE